MAGPYSTNDLAIRTLRDLNIISASETPSSDDMNYTLETIQSEFARLEADGLQFSNMGCSVDSIPSALLTELSRRMGFAVGPAFGVMSAAVGEQGKAASEAVLWRLIVPAKTPELLNIERAALGNRIRDPIISQ